MEFSQNQIKEYAFNRMAAEFKTYAKLKSGGEDEFLTGMHYGCYCTWRSIFMDAGGTYKELETMRFKYAKWLRQKVSA